MPARRQPTTPSDAMPMLPPAPSAVTGTEDGGAPVTDSRAESGAKGDAIFVP
jgi:hypothetical protein